MIVPDVDRLDIHKLETTSIDLSKLSNVVKIDVIKKYEYDEVVNSLVNTIQINDTSNSVKFNYKADYNTKNKETEERIPNHDKYIITDDFNEFACVIFAERLKIRKLATANDLNIVEQLAIKNEEKIKKLKAFGLSYLRGESHFREDGYQNYIIFLPVYRHFKKIGNTSDISEWISKGFSNESIKSVDASNNSLGPAINYLDSKIQVKLDRRCLKGDRLTFIYKKVVNNYIVYEINVWSHI